MTTPLVQRPHRFQVQRTLERWVQPPDDDELFLWQHSPRLFIASAKGTMTGTVRFDYEHVAGCPNESKRIFCPCKPGATANRIEDAAGNVLADIPGPPVLCVGDSMDFTLNLGLTP